MDKEMFYDILGSNYDPDERIFMNNEIIRQLLEKFDTSRFNLGILNDVFVTFLKNDKKIIKTIKEDDFKYINVGNKKSFSTSFVYDERTWMGTVVKEKWINGKDQEEWFTYNIKLPNDGYFYNSGYSKVVSKKGDKYFIELLKEEHHGSLIDIFEYIDEFFGEHSYTWKVFYFTRRNRVNFRIDCEELRVCLMITFENGHPEEDVVNGYGKKELKEMLKKKKL
eukprot:gene7626-11948_t